MYNNRLTVPILSVLTLSSIALGVQRTILSAYSNSLNDVFNGYIIVSAAIALSSYGFFKAIGNYTGGILSQKFGRKLSEISGVVLLIIGGTILIFALSNTVFYLGNGFVGLGIGILFASSAISLTDIFPSANRAKAISLMELSVYIGTTLGAFTAGLLGVSRTPFVVALLIAIIALVISYFIEETKYMVKQQETIRYPKFQDKIKRINHEIPYQIEIIDNELNDIFGNILSKQTKDRMGHPTLGKRIFSPSILIVFLTGIISRIADTAIILIFPILILKYGFSLVELGIITSAFTLCWALGIAITGPFSDRVGRKAPLFLGQILEALGYVIIFYLDLNTWFPVLIIGTVFAGLGRGIYFPIPPSTATELVSPKDKAKTLGIYRFVLDFGYVIGAALIVMMVDFRSSDNIQMEPVFSIIILLLVGVAILTAIFLKDPKPGFKQLSMVKGHLRLIGKSISNSTKSILQLNIDKNTSAEFLTEAKKYEQQADDLLEQMTKATYSGGWNAADAVEVLQLSNKIDKVAGYTMRSVRKLHMIDDTITDSLNLLLVRYAIILQVLVETSQEVISLIGVRIDLAAEHTYQVNLVEEILDYLHKSLWTEIKKSADKLSAFNLILLIEAIESLEKGANMLEDAIEIIRILAFKHQLY